MGRRDLADLEAALTRGRGAFADLHLDEHAFARHLARVIACETNPPSIETYMIEDLYLACACVERVPGAASLFLARYGTVIQEPIARLVQRSDIAEVAQRLIDGMLVGSGSDPPKIASYAGRAPLDRWLRVAAQRIALMWLRQSDAEARARRGIAVAPPANPLPPELTYLKERYRGDFERALADALGRAPERDRALLRLHVINGVSVEKVGRMYGVSQATASRWLAAARRGLLDDMKATLRSRLGVSSAEVASLADLVASRLDLSLSMVLETQ
jgi:RNA polymerase sigma-70 factor (ECF subfamily)